MTTAAAIQKAGYANAVLKTDAKMLSLIRADIIKEFFTFLDKGTGTATGKGLQAAAANADAKLGDALEKNGDASTRIIHFINRKDAAAYLGAAPITTQNVFGLTYLENFLGMTNVILTSQVPKGTMYATPAENIHIFGIDFAELAQGGLTYAQSANGLIGVARRQPTTTCPPRPTYSPACCSSPRSRTTSSRAPSPRRPPNDRREEGLSCSSATPTSTRGRSWAGEEVGLSDARAKELTASGHVLVSKPKRKAPARKTAKSE